MSLLNEALFSILVIAFLGGYISGATNEVTLKLTMGKDSAEGSHASLHRPPSSCAEVFANRILYHGNGIYTIQMGSISTSLRVYCMADPKGGLPWTVVQRRVDDTTSFYRGWAEYKKGFGNLERNFFIGLDNLHALTTQGEPQELWVQMTDPDDITANVYYDRFTIGSEAEEYALKELGKFSGDTADSFTYHKGSKFSTFDRDNDLADTKNCAQAYEGAWWYNNCHHSHLNGVYGSTKFGRGVNWGHYRGARVSLRYVHMAIRPTRS